MKYFLSGNESCSLDELRWYPKFICSWKESDIYNMYNLEEDTFLEFKLFLITLIRTVFLSSILNLKNANHIKKHNGKTNANSMTDVVDVCMSE